MKVKKLIDNRLILQGIPQGDTGMWLPPLVGLIFCIVPGLLFREVDMIGPRIMVWLFFVIGLAILAFFVHVMCRRERLTIEKNGACVHETWNILGGERKRNEYASQRVAAVRLNHREKSVGSGSNGGSSTVDIWEAALLIDKPRRKIVLAEDNSADGKHSRSIASTTATFLDVELRD